MRNSSALSWCYRMDELEHNELTVREIVNGIRSKKRTVALIATAVFLTVAITTFLTPKTYVSDSELFVRLGRENAALDVTATLGQQQPISVPISREVEINSISELIQSRELLDAIIEEFGEQRINDFGIVAETENAQESTGGLGGIKEWLVQMGILNNTSAKQQAIFTIEKSLSAEPIKECNLVQVSYRSRDPEFSRSVVSFLVNEYVDFHARIHRTEGVPHFLEEQTARVDKELRQNEDELEKLKSKANLVAVEDQRRLVAERITSLEQQTHEFRATEASLVSEVRALRKRWEELPALASIASTTGAGTVGVDGMRQQFYELQLQHEQLKSRYTSEHREVVAIKKQIDSAKKILDEVERERTEVVSGPNRVFDEIRVKLISKEAELEAIKSRIASTDQSIVEFRAELQQFIEFERRHTVLVRKIGVNERAFENYSQSLERARMGHALQRQSLSNIAIAQSATLNETPVAPNKKLNLAIGLVAGLVIGCGYAAIRTYFTQPQPVYYGQRRLEVPVVARIPYLEPLVSTASEVTNDA